MINTFVEFKCDSVADGLVNINRNCMINVISMRLRTMHNAARHALVGNLK